MMLLHWCCCCCCIDAVKFEPFVDTFPIVVADCGVAVNIVGSFQPLIVVVRCNHFRYCCCCCCCCQFGAEHRKPSRRCSWISAIGCHLWNMVADVWMKMIVGTVVAVVAVILGVVVDDPWTTVNKFQSSLPFISFLTGLEPFWAVLLIPRLLLLLLLLLLLSSAAILKRA